MGSWLFWEGASDTVPCGTRVFPGCLGEAEGGFLCVGSFKFIPGRLRNTGLLLHGGVCGEVGVSAASHPEGVLCWAVL